MAMQFYKRIPLPSAQMRIIDLVKNLPDPLQKSRKVANTIKRSFTKFEFKTRAERDDLDLAHEVLTENITRLDSVISHLNEVTDNSMIPLD